MHICFITNKYPNKVEPNAIVFLQQLVNAIAKKGVRCSVICPVPTNLNRAYKTLPEHCVEMYGDAEVEIYYPRYFGLGQKDYLCFNPAKFTTNRFSKAVESVVRALPEVPDAFYAHFITPAGICAARMGRVFDRPSFVAYGEATLGTINHYGQDAVKRELASLTGVIAVSTQNKEMIAPFVQEGITEVFPNAIDGARFYPRDKAAAREKFGLTPEDFVIAFVGSFDKRKGTDRLSAAVDRLDGNIKLMCAGKGALPPTTERCIYQQPVLNAELPEFLSAADIFVLPTLHEGCCNAIIEAMACGLPIVSANRSFNDDILDETNSLRIDPTSVEEIAEAIKRLREDENLRRRLAEGSLEKAKRLTLESRAERILQFMEKVK